MNNGLIQVNVASTHSPKIDQNIRFLKMVKLNLSLNDKGG